MEQTEILDTLWEQLYAEAKIREQGSRESCYFQQWMCNMENLLMDALSLEQRDLVQEIAGDILQHYEHKTVSFYRQGTPSTTALRRMGTRSGGPLFSAPRHAGSGHDFRTHAQP